MDWLGAARAVGYLRIFALLHVAMLLFLLLTSQGGVDRNGFLIGSDFISFWTVGRMLGSGASVYDVAAHTDSQRSFFASATGYTAFFYPPVFLPFCRPLGLLGYFPALGAWILATGAFYIDALLEWRRGLALRLPSQVPMWLLLLAFPAVPIVITHGQTSFVVAGLLGFGLWLVRDRPGVAGIFIGLATIKPQFGVLVLLALLVSGQWRAIASATLTAGVVAVLTTLAFGVGVWSDWWAASARAEAAMSEGLVGFGKMVSLYAGLRLVGLGSGLAYALHAVAALLVSGAVAKAAWRGRFDAGLAALVLAGAPLVTPFVLDYDMVLLAFPLMWLLAQGLGTGWRDWEKLAFVSAFAAPAFARPLALHAGVPIMPLVLGFLFVVLFRRATSPAPGHSTLEGA